jgi:predicted esterase
VSEGGAPAPAAREAAAPEPAERHVVVPRTARVYTLGDAAAPRERWVVLHGYGQLAAYFARHFAPHAETADAADARLVVVPEALSRFYLESRLDGPHGDRVGATWMTREDREAEIDDYVRWLDLALADALAGRVDVPLSVLGFSQGTATACRWLAARDRHGAPPAARLVLWAGDVPPELDLAAAWLRRTRLTFVAGTADPFADAARVAAIRARLDAAAVPLDVVRFDGGHRLDADALARVLGDVGAAG